MTIGGFFFQKLAFGSKLCRFQNAQEIPILLFQERFPFLNIIPRLMQSIALGSNPQQRFRTGKSADNPASVFKTDLASICPIYAIDGFRKTGDLMGVEDQLMQILFALMGHFQRTFLVIEHSVFLNNFPIKFTN